ncbi:MAG TPA: glutathione S-transferase family protein [Steroidobacteraceae bacterium]|jgi:glutathione S-transferase
MFELYDFTFSHYSEKARWALDFKGVPYTPRHLLPGFHMRTTRKLAPRSSVPILKTDNAVIQGSTQIIDFLDHTFPDRSLTPPDPQDAASAIEWERYVDVEIGVTLRLWFYHHTLPDRERALRFLCADATWLQRCVFALSFTAIRGKMIQFMNINAETASSAEQRFAAALDRLDQALERGPFLVGNRFSRADLSACSLLWPLCRPGESESEVEALLCPTVSALRKQVQHRPFYRWVLERYKQDRTSRAAR